MNHLLPKGIVFALLLFAFCISGFAQSPGTATLSTNYEAANGFDICSTPDSFSVAIENTTGAVMSGVEFSANLADGLMYDGLGAGSIGFSELDISDLNEPTFSYAGNIAIGATVEVVIIARGGCELVTLIEDGETPINIYTLSYGSGAFYNSLTGEEFSSAVGIPVVPMISINPAHSSINAATGEMVSREISVYNTSFTSGSVDTLYFYDIHDSTEISVSALFVFNEVSSIETQIDNLQSFVAGDTTVYFLIAADFTAAGIGTSFDGGETLILRERVIVAACPPLQHLSQH